MDDRQEFIELNERRDREQAELEQLRKEVKQLRRKLKYAKQRKHPRRSQRSLGNPQ